MNKLTLTPAWKGVLGLLLLLDLGYSFYQHFHTPIFGDLAHIVLPLPGEVYYEAIRDPFGWKVLTEGAFSAGVNRFFAHWFTDQYFRHIPLILQAVFSPIDSVYMACAIAKTAIQVWLLYLLTSYIVGPKKNWWHSHFILMALLIVPLFQTAGGFNRTLGLIDISIVYALFYALPMALLLVFFRPYFWMLFHRKEELELPVWHRVLLTVLAVVLPFSGPLMPGIIPVVGVVLLAGLYWHGTKLTTFPPYLVVNLVLIGLLSIYSLYLGRFNLESIGPEILPLSERFRRLPHGLFYLLTVKMAWPLLFFMLFLNAGLLIRFASFEQRKPVLQLVLWGLVFGLVYTALLPLGGYRPYRPDSVRYDTFMPVTVGAFLGYAASTFTLLKVLRQWWLYTILVLGFSLVLMNGDRVHREAYDCERAALEQLAKTSERPAVLPANCPIMHWEVIDEKGASTNNARLFKHWNITDELVLYYQQ